MIRDNLLIAFPELHPDDIKSTSMGAQGEDVQLSPAARAILPIAIEAKARRSLSVQRFFEQAQEHATATKQAVEPVVVIKEDRSKPLVLIDFDFFITLMQDRYDHYKDWLTQEQAISKQAVKEKRNGN